MKLLENKTNITAPDADYPFGSVRDKTPSLAGTIWNFEMMSDIIQFFSKMFNESGITANGLPDNTTNGYQLFEALMSNIPKKYIKETTSILDGDVQTVTRAEIETALTPYNPFYDGFTAGTPNELVDFHVQVWVEHAANDWRLLSGATGSPGDVYARISSSGDVVLTLTGAPYGSPVNVRIILIG